MTFIQFDFVVVRLPFSLISDVIEWWLFYILVVILMWLCEEASHVCLRHTTLTWAPFLFLFWIFSKVNCLFCKNKIDLFITLLLLDISLHIMGIELLTNIWLKINFFVFVVSQDFNLFLICSSLFTFWLWCHAYYLFIYLF